MANILLIDDDRDFHEIVSLFLSNTPHKITCASSGQLGINIAAQNPPDLIILDIAMPGMDGTETCEKLRALPNAGKTHIMIMSVHSKGELRSGICTGCLDAAVSYITKPVDMNVFITAVDNALAQEPVSD
ncbi:MAG: response regulator [Magnetovibrio sp.]|nr:response regulator [Magnetovibrio sp.]